MPSFIPKETGLLFFEAGKSLRSLKDASNGQHILCRGVAGHTRVMLWNDEPPECKGGGTLLTHRSPPSLRSHSQKADKSPVSLYGDAENAGLLKAVNDRKTPRKIRKALPAEFIRAAETPSDTSTTHHSGADGPVDPIWMACIEAPGSHIDSKDESTTIWVPTPIDELQAFIIRYSTAPLLPDDAPILPIYFVSVLAPLVAHSHELTSSLVSLYLDDLDLLDHLDVLRAFFLAGDEGFTRRASAALFGKDQAGAGEALGLGRRARTRARMGLTPGPKGKRSQSHGDKGEDGWKWGIGLGLGLSERRQWPPGGAELAYALRTTLFDDSRKREGLVWEGIEDRVSFAIRDLPEDQDGRRADWMNPQCRSSQLVERGA